MTQCQCGWATCQDCVWTGDATDTVIVEYMPEHLRASHEVAGNRGEYPYNGATRLRVSRECAANMIEDEPEWCAVVGN